MLIPIGTDNPLRRTPTVNYLLIVLNAVLFLYSFYGVGLETRAVDAFLLHPNQPLLHQFISYAFLHGGWWHLIGNMFFLYIFGNSVNAKLGNLGYILLYLGGAIFSGLGHCWTSDANVLGASGAVATVTGAYMVLFPKTNVQVLYVLFFIGTVELPAFYFILFKLIIYDNILAPKMSGVVQNVAFTAHLAGYLYGIAIPMVLLALKLLPHSQFDLWALVQRWHRRKQFANMVNQQGFSPFEEAKPGRTVVRSKVTQSEPVSEQGQQIAQIRDEINVALNTGQLDRAAERYLDLVEMDSKQVLPLQQQLDVANKLMQTGKHPAAATAYEDFISHYATYPFIEQVELMVGLIYSRYLRQPDLARKHLEAALSRLNDDGQKKMCQDELSRL